MHPFNNQPDLTTFGGRLKFAMEKRNVKSEQLAQVLVRKGFAVSRINIAQWKLINENTWRETKKKNPDSDKTAITPRKGLKDSRGPYPMELQLIVLHLNINGAWLVGGGAIPMDRVTGLPSSADDLQEMWKMDKNRKFLISHVMAMNDQTVEAIIQYLAATNQIDYMPGPDIEVNAGSD